MVTKTTWEPNANPPVAFSRWAVKEINNQKHVVGCCVSEKRCKVSAPITAYSLKHKTVTLNDGTGIVLEGDSGLDKDGVAAWEFWIAMNNLAKKPAMDITSKYE